MCSKNVYNAEERAIERNYLLELDLGIGITLNDLQADGIQLVKSYNSAPRVRNREHKKVSVT
jgi:hypothetical protein